MKKIKECIDCIYSYYDDLFNELCCSKKGKYIGELHNKEEAKKCIYYNKGKINYEIESNN